MIQRVQSTWLCLAAFFSLIGIKSSFFSGNQLNTVTTIKDWSEFTATFQLPILILTVTTAVAALVAVFMYKDRKRQLMITIATMLLSVVVILLYFNAKNDYIEAKLDLGAIAGFLVPVCLFMAAKGIYKDERLVKSADRLR
ncbi:MAG: DUF4293 family protein [Sphingobacteriia bacterium]|jgi:hypothetical protein|nr:MAG: DUF4293 family protein [Sphingobacteriia bacterium]